MLARLFPSFPQGLEAEFRQSHNLTMVREARIATVLGVFLYASFYFWERLIDTETTAISLAIRFFVCASLLLVSLLPPSILVRHLQVWLTIVLSIVGLGISANGMLLTDGLNRVLAAVRKLQQDGPSADFTSKAKESARRGYEESLKQNNYWMGRLQSAPHANWKTPPDSC